MYERTFVIGDIHGDLHALYRLLGCFPELRKTDTLVFIGDYLDRGPMSAQVIAYVRNLHKQTPAKVVTLRGNHEDAWLRVVERSWPEFVLPLKNGCLATLRSFTGGAVPDEEESPADHEYEKLHRASFLPADVVEWMQSLPYHYENEHAIYVHAGLPKGPNGFLHPRDVKTKTALLWCRDQDFVKDYRGKLVVFGHTLTKYLPPELSTYTPDDVEDLWAGPCVIGLDTGCGKGGFLTGFELPLMRIYESR